MSNMDSFGGIIRRERLAKGWSLQRCAASAGTFKGYLSQIETGVLPPPSAKVIKRLCRSLGLPGAEMIALAYWEKRPKDLEPGQLLRLLSKLVG